MPKKKTKMSASIRKKGPREAGAWLKELRQGAGLTQRKLAAAVGVGGYAYIAQLEGGYCKLPIVSMRKWADALGIPASTFAKQLLAYYEPEFYQMLFESTEHTQAAAVDAATAPG